MSGDFSVKVAEKAGAGRSEATTRALNALVLALKRSGRSPLTGGRRPAPPYHSQNVHLTRFEVPNPLAGSIDWGVSSKIARSSFAPAPGLAGAHASSFDSDQPDTPQRTPSDELYDAYISLIK